MIDDLEAAVDALYGGPIGSFVADRDALAKELRSAGRKALAAEVKALRKPTVVADSLNRALRADPDAVGALVDAALELRRAQEAMLAGERGEFSARRDDYRGAVEAVVDRADGHHDEVRSAVEAAAIGGLHGELSAAAFAVPPQPSGGFGPFELGPVEGAGPGGSRSKAGSAKKQSASKKKSTSKGTAKKSAKEAGDGAGDKAGSGTIDELERKRAERAARREAEEAVSRAAADLQRAEKVLADADVIVTSLETAAAEVESQLVELESRLVEARAARDEAVEVRTRAEAEVDGAADLVAAARDSLKRLAPSRAGRRR